MFLLERQKIYIAFRKSEGYTYDIVRERLAKSVKSTGEHIIEFIPESNFKIYKLSAMRNSFNWILFGSITESEDEIVIKGHFGFEQYVKVLVYIITGFGLVILLASLFSKSLNQVSSGIAETQQFGSIIGGIFITSMLFSSLLGKLLQREKQEEIIELVKNIGDGRDVWHRW